MSGKRSLSDRQVKLAEVGVIILIAVGPIAFQLWREHAHNVSEAKASQAKLEKRQAGWATPYMETKCSDWSTGMSVAQRLTAAYELLQDWRDLNQEGPTSDSMVADFASQMSTRCYAAPTNTITDASDFVYSHDSQFSEP